MQQLSELFFVSSNENKFQEAERILSNLGVQINLFKTTLEEIQSNHLTSIARQKAINAYDIIQKPVIIEDIRYGDICYCVRTNDWAFAYNENTKQEYLFKTSPQDKKDLTNQNKELVKEMHKLINIHKKN